MTQAMNIVGQSCESCLKVTIKLPVKTTNVAKWTNSVTASEERFWGWYKAEKNRSIQNVANVHSLNNKTAVRCRKQLTRLKMNLASTRPLLSTTGRRRCSLPFWNITTVGSCRDHDDVSTRNLSTYVINKLTIINKHYRHSTTRPNWCKSNSIKAVKMTKRIKTSMQQ